jgi:hypothetical protein
MGRSVHHLRNALASAAGRAARVLVKVAPAVPGPCGAVALVIGAGRAWEPAGWIVAGLVLLAVDWRVSE